MRFFTGLIRPRATVLGNEFAGVVEAVGSGVTSFKVGDKVFGYNEGRFGAHAEYLSIPEDGSLTTMPANVTYQQAAPSTEGSHYALSHIRAAKKRSGLSSLRCNFFLCCYLRPALRRPSKVMSKAFRAAFHRLVQRWRPRPVGSRLMIARYRHFRAACSVGK